MRDELIAAFDLTDADDAVRAVVVTGAGRAFCAGADRSSGGNTFDYAKRQACRLKPSMSAHRGWRIALSRGIAPLSVSTFCPARGPKAMR